MSGPFNEDDQPNNTEHVPIVRHGRYRLDDHIKQDKYEERWRAYDQLLNRVVGIQVVSRQHPNFDAIHRAAHRAGAVVDRRIVRVIDVVPDKDDLCIVSEWVVGLPLDEFIHSPLNPQHAASLTQSVTEALISLGRTDFDRRGSAQEWGHGRITPQSIIVNPDGEVRLRGHLVQAAMYGTIHDASFSEEDIEAVGAVLEACLTARWPADVDSHLERAPKQGTKYAMPGQLRAWLPDSVDQFVKRTRIGPNQHQHLNDVRLGLLAIKQELPADDDGTLPPNPDDNKRSTLVRLGMGTAAGVVAVGLLWMGAVAVLQSPETESVASSEVNGTDLPPDGSTTQKFANIDNQGSNGSLERQLPIVAAWGISEKPKRLSSSKSGSLVHDNDITTGWRTKSYSRSDVGDTTADALLIDLGSTQSISAFDFNLIGSDSDVIIATGTKKQLLTGTGTIFSEIEHAPHELIVRKARPVDTRYASITFTRLPLGADGYQGGVLSVKVLGQ